jgi:hypothetical protein
MFRTISLVRVNDASQVERIVDAARQIYACDENVRRAEVAVGLALLDHPLAPQASYSIVMDFDDEDGWRRFRSGKWHDDFQALAAPHLESMIATQYTVFL